MGEESKEVNNLKVEVYDLVQQLTKLNADNERLTGIITDLAEIDGECIKVDDGGNKSIDLDALKSTIKDAAMLK